MAFVFRHQPGSKVLESCQSSLRSVKNFRGQPVPTLTRSRNSQKLLTNRGCLAQLGQAGSSQPPDVSPSLWGSSRLEGVPWMWCGNFLTNLHPPALTLSVAIFLFCSCITNLLKFCGLKQCTLISQFLWVRSPGMLGPHPDSSILVWSWDPFPSSLLLA